MSAAPAKPPLSYRDAGVDMEAGDKLVENIKPYARRTMRPEILAGIGGFGGLVELPKGYRQPVLVAGTDGVGTKLKLAFAMQRHDTIGIDLVAMSVNDILVQGAEPLFFLDYYVCERLDVAVATDVVKGIAKGCELAGCALIGGETAEHPGAFIPDEYDLAGFAVGVVEKSNIIDGSTIRAGDRVLGLASSGLHSNGFSLVRKILDRAGIDLNADFHGKPLGSVLLEPTRIYVKPMLALAKEMPVKGMAHITGGGLLENVPRMLAEDLTAVLQRSAWTMPPIFAKLQQEGGVADHEMHRVFNCGIGMAVVVSADDAPAALEFLEAAGETAWDIGGIEKRSDGQAQTVVV
jgi:phosphoribosylformylglycinamidine cyclo-ligase